MPWQDDPVAAPQAQGPQAPSQPAPAWQADPVATPSAQPEYEPTWRDKLKFALSAGPSGIGPAGTVEGVMNIGSGMLATPVAGVGGILQAGANTLGATTSAADRVAQLQQMLTYEPRTHGGQVLAKTVAYPFEKLAEAGDFLGEAARTSNTPILRNPVAATAISTATQMAPAVLLRGRSVPPAQAAAEAATRAQNYVGTRTGLDWNSLSEPIKQRITNIAQDATALEKLDPAALERQVQLESLPKPVPSTKGQLTRDPVQLRNEGNVSATEAGKPIRDIHVAQNKALLENLEILKGKQGGKAVSKEQVGEAVQGAARAKLDVRKKEVSRLYKEAEATGELQGNAPTRQLAKLIEETPDLQHLGWVDSWLNKANIVTDQKGQATKGMRLKASLKELEDLRQAAVARAMDGGTEGYYAGKVIRAIDEATEGAGGAAYKKARAARKAQALEFEETAGVNRLVSDASRTDRAVALEDTWKKTVVNGSIQDLRNVKQSLLTGGDATTRAAGKQAWKDIRAQTIQHIYDEATKSVTRFEDGSPNVTPASMERAIKSVGPEKLNEIFGSGTVQQLNKIMEATRTVKTEPPSGFKGSPTLANTIAFLEKTLGKVPFVGDTVTGTVRGVANLRDMGRAGREVRAAQENPLSTQVKGPINRNALNTAVTMDASSQRNALSNQPWND